MEQDLSLYKLPPQNLEAEENILSAILLDNDVLHDVTDILAPADFYKTSHKVIYDAILQLYSRNEPVDLVTLTNVLKERNKLEEAGGAVYIAGIVDTVPLAVNAQHYAKIIHDKACLRNLIGKAGEIARKCYEDRGEVDEIVGFAEKAVFEIAENKIRPSFFSISRLVDNNIAVLEEQQGNKSLVTGVPSGFKELDKMTSGFQNSDLVIIAARPGMGKTAFALNIARNAAVEANRPVAVFSLEMSKEQLSMRLLCSEARVDSSRVRSNFLGDDDWLKLTDAASVLTTAPIFIDDSPDISSLSIRAKSRRLKMEVDLGLIIIDYVQLMKSSLPAERRDLEISEISRSLKALAKELDLPVLALSQLNRKLEERSDKRPQLSDLRESGALEQDADLVAFIYRDEEYNKDENNPKKGTAEIILAKHRNGPVGSANLTFLKAYTRFEDMAIEHDFGSGYVQEHSG